MIGSDITETCDPRRVPARIAEGDIGDDEYRFA
jgi:hypothetical protein